MRIAILTVSDRSWRGERADASGPALVQAVIAQGWQVVETRILPDDQPKLTAQLIQWADSGAVDVILTTGGTGFSRRDVTPEATIAVIQRMAPGLAEAMRQASMQITPHAMLSRAVAGIRGQVLIINLPGSPRAALENLAVVSPVLPHAVQLLSEDENAEAGHNLFSQKKG
ncbi:MAG TPA: MogA/MoaB family molybdenum cofactor biosynthesis protein [Anaerolineales bacterium]|nr:MogA/MoaB family molybdenum cofactor biosynthesis protein [Anaerolineales bacterium]